MAEKLLDRAQVAAASEEMRRERMAQRMRCRRLRQAERAAQPRHRELNDPRREWAAFGADEQRTVTADLVRAEREIIGDEVLHLRQHRHHALLAALADDRDHLPLTAGEITAPQPERLGNAQPAAVEEREHGSVAGVD